MTAPNEEQQQTQQQRDRDKQRAEQNEKWPVNPDGEGRQSAADQDIGPESTPSRAGT